MLARFNGSGGLDSTFGSSGIEVGAAEGGGLAMVTASNGETVLTGKVSSGNGIILQEFGTLAKTFTYYVEYDADDNVTSITDSSGNVLERYSTDPYGNVTVLNPNGTVRGDGTLASSFFGWIYVPQGKRVSVITGTVYCNNRIDILGLDRFAQLDPDGDINGLEEYQYELSNPVNRLDPSGLDSWISDIWTGLFGPSDPKNPPITSTQYDPTTGDNVSFMLVDPGGPNQRSIETGRTHSCNVNNRSADIYSQAIVQQAAANQAQQAGMQQIVQDNATSTRDGLLLAAGGAVVGAGLEIWAASGQANQAGSQISSIIQSIGSDSSLTAAEKEEQIVAAVAKLNKVTFTKVTGFEEGTQCVYRGTNATPNGPKPLLVILKNGKTFTGLDSAIEDNPSGIGKGINLGLLRQAQ